MACLIFQGEDSAQNQIFPLGRATLIVGRDPASQIHLASQSVSRDHASIIYDDTRNFIVRDNGSTNGTYVNNEPISRHILRHGDIIQFGDYTFLFSSEDDGSKSKGTPPAPVALKAENATVTGSGSNYRAIVNLKPTVVKKNNQGRKDVGVKLMLTAPVVHSDYQVAQPVGLTTGKLIAIVMGSMVLAFALAAYLFSDHTAKKKEVSSSVSISLPNRIEVPTVSVALPLFSGPMVWAHVTKEQVPIFPLQNDSLSAGGKSGTDSTSIAQDYLSTWRRGVVIYEPPVVRVELDANVRDTVELVLEDCYNPVTFWDYNSTVTPEKKPVIGPFYVPNLKNSLFYQRNNKLAAKIQKFNREDFQWRMAERGIQWPLAGYLFNLQRDANRLRWVVFLRPAANSSTLNISTLEGDLLRDQTKEYHLDVYPAEVLAEVLHWEGINSAIAVRLNESLYSSKEIREAKQFIESNFSVIMSNRPASNVDIPRTFTLSAPKK